MESQRWEEAFHLAQQHPEFAPAIHLPWAEWLVRHDRFEEAKDAYMKAGRADLALKLLQTLVVNCVTEKRFKAVAGQVLKLANETIRAIPADAPPEEIHAGLAAYETSAAMRASTTRTPLCRNTSRSPLRP